MRNLLSILLIAVAFLSEAQLVSDQTNAIRIDATQPIEGEVIFPKIKWDYPDKVKFGKNEDLIPVWELKHKSDRIEIDYSDSNYLNIPWEKINENMVVHDEFKFYGFQNSVSPGVMLISEFDLLDQAILIAELLNHGK